LETGAGREAQAEEMIRVSAATPESTVDAGHQDLTAISEKEQRTESN